MKRGVLCMAGAEQKRSNAAGSKGTGVPVGSSKEQKKVGSSKMPRSGKGSAVRRVLDIHAIKAVLEDKGMTQVELARVLGYSSQAGVSGIITRRRTSLDKFVAVANALGYRVVVQKPTSMKSGCSVGDAGERDAVHGEPDTSASGYSDLFEVVTEWTVQDK